MTTIRLYKDSDVDAVVRLSLRAWEPVFASMKEGLDPEVYRAFYPSGWRVSQKASVEAVCADPDQRVWVAEKDGEIAGFVSVVLRHEDRLGEIYMIAVDPDHQRAGLGVALTHHAAEWMREAGMEIAMIRTGGDPGHAPARQTYERAGFRYFPSAQFFKKL